MDTVKPTTILDIEVVGSSVYFLCLCEDNVVQYFRIRHLLDIAPERFDKTMTAMDLARVVRNFKNIAKTLAHRHQNYMCYQLMNDTYLQHDTKFTGGK